MSVLEMKKDTYCAFADDVAEEYLSCLVDLTINSRPIITMLTVLAEENADHAANIVEVIEQQVLHTSPECKLPVLYLIDSIVKNVQQYRKHFSLKIPKIFCEIFKTANREARLKMHELRCTWNGVFPPTKLYMLDITVKTVDPNWPIAEQILTENLSPKLLQPLKSTNHVKENLQVRRNEREVTVSTKNQKRSLSERKRYETPSVESSIKRTKIPPKEQEYHHPLNKKPMESVTSTISNSSNCHVNNFSFNQTNFRLILSSITTPPSSPETTSEERSPAKLDILPTRKDFSTGSTLSHIDIDESYKQLIASGFTGFFSSSCLETKDGINEDDQLKAPIFTESRSAPLLSETPLSTLNVNELIKRLTTPKPICSKKAKSSNQNLENAAVDLSRRDTIKERNSDPINTLYSGKQCSNCGLRFLLQESTKYREHLDWHFRQNRRHRDEKRKANSRKFLLKLSDWMQYQEVEFEEERVQNWFEKQEEHRNLKKKKSLDMPEVKEILVQDEYVISSKGLSEECEVCHEKFENVFHDENEEWCLKNAMRVKEKVYHPICYEDLK